jgi:hypothetical protein
MSKWRAVSVTLKTAHFIVLGPTTHFDCRRRKIYTGALLPSIYLCRCLEGGGGNLKAFGEQRSADVINTLKWQDPNEISRKLENEATINFRAREQYADMQL